VRAAGFPPLRSAPAFTPSHDPHPRILEEQNLTYPRRAGIGRSYIFKLSGTRQESPIRMPPIWSSDLMKATDIRRGHVIFFEGQPCRVMEFAHRTPGNLRAFVQARMRNLNTGSTFEHRFSATEFIEEARLDTKQLQVLYRDGNGVHVMDAETYDQFTLDDETAGNQGQWLEPGMTFQAEWLNGRPIAIELPAVAELEVVETAPVMKTATKTASTKPARLSNGVTIQVPEFINEGERVRVNPRDGVYLERAK
jgi:elongation factor P